ncbi:hypothetical protein HAT2_00595 [Candidatus Similichlamydia laticola]|uniref:Uncharacterized protein n=1 Tax=Candidatus Similichlamydia laticola TaxID=2170265 RepID=A0A369KCH8_9BACT|nr:hypothetical protein HAT2_00595 [Candidatus Similichlamydia laticola]
MPSFFANIENFLEIFLGMKPRLVVYRLKFMKFAHLVKVGKYISIGGK